MSSLRKFVLQSFKKLHRTRIKVFEGDEKALTAARIKINDEYQKNKHVTDEVAIKAMIKFGEDVERELKTQVIQAREIKPGVFEARITEDTLKLENMPYNPNAVTEDGTPRPETCCQDNAQTKGNIS
ncbi:complex III assembly factor LYRM7 isoform X2 [Achroia grisella]|uniref:complex III assembly factor LYRM7 isoform X2 n=1 Tax=Achroia grisella TaxID=688607 RepID=UPI0027D34EAC|nr:complex III assembly factor LYRM7 isoform X2 [Achroia grisella]